jgi:hypothetical protein
MDAGANAGACTGLNGTDEQFINVEEKGDARRRSKALLPGRVRTFDFIPNLWA